MQPQKQTKRFAVQQFDQVEPQILTQKAVFALKINAMA
jgi:hypothetical protein